MPLGAKKKGQELLCARTYHAQNTFEEKRQSTACGKDSGTGKEFDSEKELWERLFIIDVLLLMSNTKTKTTKQLTERTRELIAN